jgi:hypothetical protein
MTTAADKLAELVEELEEKLLQANHEIEQLRDKEPWTAHEDCDNDDSGLPVPRLEMIWEESEFSRGYNWRCRYRLVYRWRCRYRLVYRHLLGHYAHVPLGETLVGGHMAPFREGDKLDTPFRDGAHISCDAAHLMLPAYVRYGDRTEEIEPKEFDWDKDQWKD